MPADPNKLQQFWKELKRRKVVRVLTLYAGAAYIIIELVNNVIDPLHLPEWTATLVILLLAIGFPVTAILSWIFDITPEGVKKTEPEPVGSGVAGHEGDTPIRRRRFSVSDGIIAILVIVIGILVYPKIFGHESIEDIRSKGKISLAVLPFQNLTNDSTWNVWQPGIQNNLITQLSNYSDQLTVRQIESVNQLTEIEGHINNASITPDAGSSISRKLGAEVFICGSINSDPENIRINAQLIHSTSGEIFKSFQINVPKEQALNFKVIDELSAQVKDFLLLSQRQQETPDNQLPLVSTSDPEAYSAYVKGKNAFAERDYNRSIDFLSEANRIDTNFIFPLILASMAYENLGEYDRAREMIQIAYNKRESLSPHLRAKVMDQYASIQEGAEGRIRYLKQLQEYDEQDPFGYSDLGFAYLGLQMYQQAIPQYEKALEIYGNWGTKPFWSNIYVFLGYAYHQTGQYRKEKRIYRRAEKDFPGDRNLLRRQAIFFLHKGNSGRADTFLEAFKNALKDSATPEADIQSMIAGIYREAELLDMAEDTYRSVIDEYGETPARVNELARFLIETDRNPEEGLDLIEKVLSDPPDKFLYDYLDTKGWALYRLGLYEESLSVLNEAADLSPVYGDRIHRHIREAEQALAR